MTVHLGGWIETRSWQPVMAEVLEVRLNPLVSAGALWLLVKTWREA